MRTLVLVFLSLLWSLCAFACNSSSGPESSRFAANVHLLCYKLFPNEKRIVMKWLSKGRCSVLLESGKELFQATGTHNHIETLTFAGSSSADIADSAPSTLEFGIISAALSNEKADTFLRADHRLSIAKLGQKFIVSIKGLDDRVGNQITCFFSSAGKLERVAHGR